MIRFGTNHRSFALAVGLAASVFGATLAGEALGDPGTCQCNDGCHSFPGQCTHSNGCNVGYAPVCGTRPTGTCPKVGWVSCDGTCTCEPIAGFDAGAGSSGTTSSSGASTSSGTTSSGGSSGSLGGSFIDASVPPPLPDAGPCSCPNGNACTGCAGADNFCASPCSPTEFPCSGGQACVQGFCVPVCCVSACVAPALCDPGSGECTGDDGGAGSTFGNGSNGGSVNQGDGSFAGGEGGLGDQGSGGVGGGGCGCVVADGRGGSVLGGVLAALFGVAFASRRRR